MKQDIHPVNIKILDKEFLVACQEEERDDLLAAADYLRLRIQEVQRSGKVIGADRIIMLAALNIAHECLQQQDLGEELNQTLGVRILGIQNKIDAALNRVRQMEF